MSDYELTEFEKKVKERQKKKNAKWMLKIGVIVLLSCFLLIYLVTPLSKVKGYSVSGNKVFSNSLILNLSGVNEQTSLFSVNEKEMEENLKSCSLINDAKVKTSIFGLHIDVEEIDPILKVGDDILLNNNINLNKSLLNDEIIGESLSTQISVIPSLLEDENIVSTRVKYFSTIYYMTSKEYRERIKYINFHEQAISYFVSIDNSSDYLEVYIPLNSYREKDVSYALDKESYTRYISYLVSNSNNRDESNKLVKKNYTKNDKTLFEYYSIKVIIESVNGKVTYQIYNL